MLSQILIKNFILIDELFAKFDKGLNVITGETGAGKSIFIHAIDLVFAPRISKDVIKTGCDKASIELTLTSDKNLSKLFEEYGIDDFGSEIVISKEISQSSVRTRVNGTLVNQDFVKEIKDKFLDIHSQHQTYSLLQPKTHIGLLDSYGESAYGEKLIAYQNLYSEYQNLLKKLEQAKTATKATDSQIEFLKFQINEIEEAEIEDVEEDEKIKSELKVLENAEKLKELTGAAAWTLSGDDDSVLNAMSQIKLNISKSAKMDESLSELEERFINAVEELSDISRELGNYASDVENDTDKLNSLQERLFLLEKLEHKYGGNLSEVLLKLEEFTSELLDIEKSDENISELEKEKEKFLSELNVLGDEISENRRNFAEVLSVLIVEKLENLELPKAKFKILVEPSELSSMGKDNVEFMISTNVSEALKPLAKVASGGEISRIMLAIKAIFAQNDDIDTVIFDEIDTGISGKASQSVADEISELAKYHQIVLITHQPIIASKADKHFYVTKSQGENKTNIGFYVLEGENRVKALAELAGGDINEKSLDFARSLIEKV